MARFRIESRALAGIRFEDVATSTAVDVPLDVRAAEGEVRVVTHANRRGIYVIAEVEGLEEYVATFQDPPATPAEGSVVVAMEVRDPSGMYLPRRFSVALPRDPDRGDDDSIFEPLVVSLYRSPLAGRSQNWAMLRVRLNAGAGTDPVPAALLRVVHDPAGTREVLGVGMSVVADPRARELERRVAARRRWVHFTERHVGEATVPVVGLSGQVWNVDTTTEDVVLADIPAALEILPMTLPGPGQVPDPDAFLGASAAAGNTRPITLSVGGEVLADPFPVTL